MTDDEAKTLLISWLDRMIYNWKDTLPDPFEAKNSPNEKKTRRTMLKELSELKELRKWTKKSIQPISDNTGLSWEIESVDRYYYASGRNYDTYKEVTFYFNCKTLERKEVVREVTILSGDTWSLPEWAKSVTVRRKSLESHY